MEKTREASQELEDGGRGDEPTEAVELVLFHVGECYVYLIPPRKSAASYRADEWDVNKWAWEGALKVISKGEECIIRLEDKSTGELYARAFLREGEPHPVEPVIDSSRYFVLRVEENIGGRIRHAFIGIGFRERTEAYDFQAALHDHLKYLNKKKTAEEMEQHFQHTSSVDYSLKEGQTLVLKIKTKGSPGTRSSTVDQGVSNLSLDEKSPKGSPKGALLSLKPPPPPPSPLSPVASPKQSTDACQEQSANLQESAGTGAQADNGKAREVVEDDFGDFQTAG